MYDHTSLHLCIVYVCLPCNEEFYRERERERVCVSQYSCSALHCTFAFHDHHHHCITLHLGDISPIGRDGKPPLTIPPPWIGWCKNTKRCGPDLGKSNILLIPSKLRFCYNYLASTCTCIMSELQSHYEHLQLHCQ